MTKLEQIFSKSEKNNLTGCYELKIASSTKGYGQCTYLKKMWLTHRLVYFLVNGPFDKKFLICHKCDVRKCVNPDHLYLGTAKNNADDREKRSKNLPKNKTHCKNGHIRNSINTRINSNGRKECKICGRDSSNRYNAKKRK